MNLEDIEQKVLGYLEQSSNPMIRVDVLLSRLRQREEFAQLDRTDLLEFLAHHDLFRVFDPLNASEDDAGEAEGSEGAIAPTPYVILRSRVPTPTEMTVQISGELGKMSEALDIAFHEALNRGDTAKANEIKDALARTEDLRKRVSGLDNGPGDS